MASQQHFSLALNENPCPPLPGVVEALHGQLDHINLTLDALGTGLTEAIAARIGVPAADVVVGAGSAALLQQALSVCAAGGREVVHAWPSFEMYPLMIRNASGVPVAVPLAGFHHDPKAMAAAANERTGAIVVCNPNNPTGTLLTREDLRQLLDTLTFDVPVIVDEAYLDFADDPTAADAVELYRQDPRVCVVRTFSKSYGLLGLRVGYLVGHERITAPLRTLLPFFRVNNLGQAAALAALRAEAEMRARCAGIAAERERVRAALFAQGRSTPPSAGNFLWLPLGDAASAFADRCAERGVLVRAIAGEGVRVTVGEPTADDAFLAVCQDIPTLPTARAKATRHAH